MDYSFFALGLLGAFIGYLIGDFQRQSRYRRDARANLALANQRAIDRAKQRAAVQRPADSHHGANTGPHDGANTGSDHGTNADLDRDGGTFVLAGTLSRQARRRAVPRTDNGPRSGRYAAGGSPRRADAAPVMVGGWDGDGD